MPLPWPPGSSVDGAAPAVRKDTGLGTLRTHQSAALVTARLHLDAERAAGRRPRGIIVQPCGAGKTLTFVSYALQRGSRVVFVVHESSAAPALHQMLCKHTTLHPKHVLRYYGEHASKTLAHLRKLDARAPAYLVTTYAMVNTAMKRGDLRAALWRIVPDLVVLDECHHLSGDTADQWNRSIKQLLAGHVTELDSERAQQQYVLGLTGTLTSTSARRVAEQATARLPPEQRPDAHALLEWERESYAELLGAVIYEVKWKALVDAGELAQLDLHRVQLERDPLFSRARAALLRLRKEACIKASLDAAAAPAAASAAAADDDERAPGLASVHPTAVFDAQSKRLNGLTPEKLEAILWIVAAHQDLGQRGIVFFESVLAAEQLQACLRDGFVNRPAGADWLLMRGGQDWDPPDTHRKTHAQKFTGLMVNPEQRHEALQRFNDDRQCSSAGFIATRVASSAVDVHGVNYIILAQSDSSTSTCAQQIGRGMRSLRDATGAPLPKAQQRRLCVYDLVSVDGDRKEALEQAARRHAFLESEGFEYKDLSLADLRQLRAEPPPRTGCAHLTSPLGLLLRNLAEVDVVEQRTRAAEEAKAELKTSYAKANAREARRKAVRGGAVLKGIGKSTKTLTAESARSRTDSACAFTFGPKATKVLVEMLVDGAVSVEQVVPPLRALFPNFQRDPDELAQQLAAFVRMRRAELAKNAAPAAAPAPGLGVGDGSGNAVDRDQVGVAVQPAHV